MDKDGDFMVDSVSMYHGQSLQVWKVKPMQKCFKPALFLIASWGQLHLLQKDVRFYLSLWENDPNFDPTATPYSQNKINTSNSKKTKMVTPNSRLQNDSPQTNDFVITYISYNLTALLNFQFRVKLFCGIATGKPCHNIQTLQQLSTYFSM